MVGLQYLVFDGFFYCFCLLAESYETINHHNVLRIPEQGSIHLRNYL